MILKRFGCTAIIIKCYINASFIHSFKCICIYIHTYIYIYIYIYWFQAIEWLLCINADLCIFILIKES